MMNDAAKLILHPWLIVYFIDHNDYHLVVDSTSICDHWPICTTTY